MHVDDLEFVIINDKKFLRSVVGDGNDRGTYHYYYSIDPNTNSIKQIGEPVKASVKPTVIGRNETLTVELGDFENSNNTITVHDAAGKTVYQTTVPAGQQTVQINASALSQGLNVVSVKGKKGRGESCKVIVK